MPLILTTGLAGFLGSHVGAVLQANGFEVENMPLGLRRSPANLPLHLSSRQPAGIVHMAGIVDVRYCREHPLEAFQAHVSDTANLLEAIRTTCPETPLIYVATDKSFGEQEFCGLKAHYQAGFPYETSKAAEDFLVESYAATYGLPICLLRFPNFFGEGDRHAERLIPSICLAAAAKHELVVRTRLDGTIRQYLYVRDAADIVLQTLQTQLAGNKVWPKNHFGPPCLKTVGDVIRDVESITGERLNVAVLNQPGEVSRLSLLDENYLNYRYTPWLDALAKTVRWYARKNL